MSQIVVTCRKLSWRLSQIVVTYFFTSPSRRPPLVFADSREIPYESPKSSGDKTQGACAMQDQILEKEPQNTLGKEGKNAHKSKAFLAKSKEILALAKTRTEKDQLVWDKGLAWEHPSNPYFSSGTFPLYMGKMGSICHFPCALPTSIWWHCSQVLVFTSTWGIQKGVWQWHFSYCFSQHLVILGPPNTAKQRKTQNDKSTLFYPPPPPHLPLRRLERLQPRVLDARIAKLQSLSGPLWFGSRKGTYNNWECPGSVPGINSGRPRDTRDVCQKTREGCGCFRGLFGGSPGKLRESPGKLLENFSESRNATNSRIWGTGKGKPAANLGCTPPRTLSRPSAQGIFWNRQFQPSRVFPSLGRFMWKFTSKGQNVRGTDGTDDGTDGTCPRDRRDTNQGVSRQNSLCLLVFSFPQNSPK